MGENRVFLSIVTPTYNRAELLKKCYQSLMVQTEKNFEWVIVDDGSSDNTWEVISSFQADFPIYCIHKENGGKHTALNASHEHIHGRYVLILDSDDYLVPTAVAQVKAAWDTYIENPEIGMVVLLKGSAPDKPNCIAPTPNTCVDILRYRRKVIRSGDCCEVIPAELFLKYPFPIFEGERFLSEGVLWHRVGMTHKCVYINSVIYICEYLDNGLTRSERAMRIRNPLGGMYNSEICMQKKNYLKQRIKKGLLYCCYGYFAGMSARKIFGGAKYKALTAICLLPGYLLYLYWKKKYL